MDDVAEKTVAVESGRVGGSQFTLEARRIGKFKLTLSASMDGARNRADIVVREIEVIPNGREQNMVFNGRLETSVRHDVNFPAAAIPDAGKIFVRLYPGPLSQVIEGMDSHSAHAGRLLRADVVEHLSQRAGARLHEAHEEADARGARQGGGLHRQRLSAAADLRSAGRRLLLVRQAPANKILTAYGLMEFSDMSKVYDVDPQADPAHAAVAGGAAAGRRQLEAGHVVHQRRRDEPLQLRRAAHHGVHRRGRWRTPATRVRRWKRRGSIVGSHMGAKVDAYTLAVLANFAADYGKDREFTRQAMQLLLDARTEKDEQAWWTAEETGVYATGASAAVETTGLAVQALLKWGEASATAAQGAELHRVEEGRVGHLGHDAGDHHGAARAAALDGERRGGRARHGRDDAQRQAGGEADADAGEQRPAASVRARRASMPRARNRCRSCGSRAREAWRIRWWAATSCRGARSRASEPLSIDVAYDRTRLAQDDIATATATVRNNLAEVGEHGDGGPGDSAGVRSAERRLAGICRRRRPGRRAGGWRSSA